MEELSTIRSTQMAQAPALNSNWREQWSRLAKFSGSTPTRSEILSAYGQTEETIKEHTARMATADARRLTNHFDNKAIHNAKQQTAPRSAQPG